MTIGSFQWGVVLPVARANLIENPSFETRTTGWAGSSLAGIGTVPGTAAFGAWALRAIGVNDGMGATTTVALGAGTAYTASAYVAIYGATGGSVQIGIGGTSSRVPVGSAWQRISVGTTFGAAAAYTLGIQRYGANAGTLFIDGVQVEAGSITTYIDGDQDGCQWVGVPHASPSVRSGDSRTGGSLVALAAVGLRPETTPGYGVAPTVNQLQDYAISDGAEYQRTRYEARPLTITATLTGTTTPDLHRTRRRVIDVLKAGRTPTPQPARLYFWGGGGTVAGDFLYSDGLDGSGENVISEQVAVRLVAPDPAWSDTLDQGTTLAPYTVLGSTNYVAYRDPEGRWGTMVTAGTSVSGTVFALAADTGTVFVAGSFFRAGGTLAHLVAQWANGAWGSFTGGQLGTASALVDDRAMALRMQAGTLFVGGAFDTAGGTVAPLIAQWSLGVWGTLTGGTLNVGPGGDDVINAIETIPGRPGIYVGGIFNGITGTPNYRYIAQWNGAWGTLRGGTLNTAGILSLAPALNGTLYVGVGDGANSVAGTTFNPSRPIWWNGSAWGTVAGAATGSAVYAMTFTPQQQLIHANNVAVGAAGLPPVHLIRSNVSGTIAGLLGSAAANAGALYAAPDGKLYAGGPPLTLQSGYDLPLDLAIWNGYSWLPPDLRVSGRVFAITQDPIGTLYIGGAFTGIGTAASVTTIVNRGMGDSYPVLRVRHTGAGTARVFQFLNTTTGDEIYFNLVMIPGERAMLDLRPESLSFTSNVRGTIISSILGGSNLSTWRLAPGTNTISFFADNPNVVADLYWRPRHLSVDGGAEPTL